MSQIARKWRDYPNCGQSRVREYTAIGRSIIVQHERPLYRIIYSQHYLNHRRDGHPRKLSDDKKKKKSPRSARSASTSLVPLQPVSCSDVSQLQLRGFQAQRGGKEITRRKACLEAI